MLSRIKTYALGFFAALAGYFAIKSKFQEHEIEELEEENEAKTKNIVINNIVEEAVRRAEEDEEVQKSNIDDSNYRNNI